MAQPKNVAKDTTYWHYTGQSKEHATISYRAAHHDYTKVANVLNDDPEIQAGRSEYQGACETGTAVFVRTETEWVG